MTNNKQQKDKSFGAALVGAAVGVAAGAAAVALTNERNRKKIKVEFNKAVRGGSKAVNELKKDAVDFGEKAQEAVALKVEELQKEIAKRMDQSNDSVKKLKK